jgi:hypothetical protein
MKKMLYTWGFLFAFLAVGHAQQTIELGQNVYDEAKGIVYDREFTIDIKLHTHGFALGANIARLKTYYLTNFINFELGEIRHPKQFRQSFDFRPSINGRISRAFVFGKENNFFVLRGGLGPKRYISEKTTRRGPALGVTYQLGPSLGLLKPYYLELQYTDEGANDLVTRSERFSEQNANVFLDIVRIFGASSFSRGIDEISVIPGGHGKFAVHFDWGAFDEFVKAVEAGVMFDFYLRKVPIMVESPEVRNTENRSLFINLFINLQLGKRW